MEGEEIGTSEKKAKNVIDRLLSDSTPILLKTRSGLGEEIWIGVNRNPPEDRSKNTLSDAYGMSHKETLTVNVYVKGNGLLHPEGKLVVVAFSNAAVLEDNAKPNAIYNDWNRNDWRFLRNGEELPVNLKHVAGSALSTQRVQINEDNTHEENSHWVQEVRKLNPTEPDKKAGEFIQTVTENGDPYRGMGNLMQSVIIGYMQKNNVSKVINGYMLSSEPQNLWQRWGSNNVQSGETGEIDFSIAKPKIIEVINKHFN